MIFKSCTWNKKKQWGRRDGVTGFCPAKTCTVMYKGLGFTYLHSESMRVYEHSVCARSNVVYNTRYLQQCLQLDSGAVGHRIAARPKQLISPKKKEHARLPVVSLVCKL